LRDILLRKDYNFNKSFNNQLKQNL
jgi:hypothetical protein